MKRHVEHELAAGEFGCAAAYYKVLFQDQHFLSFDGEVRGGGESSHAGADDNDVIVGFWRRGIFGCVKTGVEDQNDR